MTDGIYNNVRRPALDSGARGTAAKSDGNKTLGLLTADAAPIEVAKPKSKVVGSDQLHLSNVSQRLAAEPGFDRAKVDSIKKAIQEGNYPLNAHRIAESFHAIEQMISQ